MESEKSIYEEFYNYFKGDRKKSVAIITDKQVVFRISTSDSTEVESIGSYTFFANTSWDGKYLVAGANSNTKWRIWHYDSSGIEFSNGKVSAGGTVTNSSSTMIPLRVIGMK